MAADENDAGLHDLVSPFLFVPLGDTDPVEWKAAHRGWVTFPATMVPRVDPPEADAAPGPDRARWPKDRRGHRYRPFDEYGPGERAPGERSAEFAEPDADAFRAMMAVMDDPLGTLRELGYDATQAVSPIKSVQVAGRPLGRRKNTTKIDAFLDQLDAPLQSAAQELGLPVNWLLGLAAYESGWLDPHNRYLNNPLGLTHGGGNNVKYASVAYSIRYFVAHYGPQVRGSASPADFADRLEGELNGVHVPGWHTYNTKNRNWRPGVIGAIASMPQHCQNWMEDRSAQ